MTEAYAPHIPVLAGEVLRYFGEIEPFRKLLDGTLGNAGHSKRLLEAHPDLEVLGIDRDRDALERARLHLGGLAGRVRFVHGEYADMGKIAAEANWSEVDGVLLDIGVSSPQLDEAARGFSWRQDGPLDMRMNREELLTASRVVNRYTEEDLARIFRDYGELPQARRLARAIAERRAEKPFAATVELAEFCETVLGRSRPGKLPLPTLVFQALRIEVNGELEQLRRGLKEALKLLRPGGRLAVITFHSLEDRIVKQFMHEAARECVCPPGLPVCVCNHHAELALPVRGVITAGADELARNRRAAPAKLRIADKVIQQDFQR